MYEPLGFEEQNLPIYLIENLTKSMQYIFLEIVTKLLNELFSFFVTSGFAVVHLVEVLRYKPEGRGFDSRWCHWTSSLT
jgi:hypothetical protein